MFYRIARKRGMKKAAVAVARRLLTVACVLIRNGGVYREPGGDYFDQRNPERTAEKLTKRLDRSGFRWPSRTGLSPHCPQARSYPRRSAPDVIDGGSVNAFTTNHARKEPVAVGYYFFRCRA
jgi:hypothetical protein